MIYKAKICGISESKTLRFILNHKYPPEFLGFIVNYNKSKRFVEYKKLSKLLKHKKKGVKYVAVLVNPDNKILKKINSLKAFEYVQLYNTSLTNIKNIKKNYKFKIISSIVVKNKKDINKYKIFKNVSDIILFDGKGYEKSVGFNHSWIKNLPKTFKKMLAGNIAYNENLDKFKKITDIIDISGSLETKGIKDLKKINIFLNNIKKLNDAKN